MIWTVDLESSTVTGGEMSFQCHMQQHHRETLMQGLWDSTTLLLENMDKVAKLYQSLPYANNYGS